MDETKEAQKFASSALRSFVKRVAFRVSRGT
jgi:hypothetical protein